MVLSATPKAVDPPLDGLHRLLDRFVGEGVDGLVGHRQLDDLPRDVVHLVRGQVLPEKLLVELVGVVLVGEGHLDGGHGVDARALDLLRVDLQALVRLAQLDLDGAEQLGGLARQGLFDVDLVLEVNASLEVEPEHHLLIEDLGVPLG